MMKLTGDYIWNFISFLLGAWLSLIIVVLVYPHINLKSDLSKPIHPKLNITEETNDLKSDSNITQENLLADVTVHPKLNIQKKTIGLSSDLSVTQENSLPGVTGYPKLNILQETTTLKSDPSITQENLLPGVTTVHPELNILQETNNSTSDLSVTHGNLLPDITVHPKLNILQETNNSTSDPSVTQGNLLPGITVHSEFNILQDTGYSEDDLVGKTNNTLNTDYLWRISRDDLTHESYLFGTIHVPARIVLGSLSEKTMEAFKKSDGVFGEIDFYSSEFVSKMAECSTLPLGTWLDDILSEELISRLKVYFRWLGRNYGVFIFSSTWKRLHPSDLVVLLKHVSDSIIYPKTTSDQPKTSSVSEDLILDEYLQAFGKNLSKITGGVETAEDRCQYKRNLPHHLAAIPVEFTLLELETFMDENKREFDSDTFIDLYNKKSNSTGNLDMQRVNSTEIINQSSDLDAETIQVIELLEEYDNFFIDEVLERNKKMTARMIEILTGTPDARYFFAFGVAHFFGDGSVNELLEENGFTVQRL